MEFLRLRQALLQNHKEQFSIFHKGLKERFERESTDKELDTEKESRKPDWPAAYAELFENLYKNHDGPADEWEAQYQGTRSAWRQGLIEWYNSGDPESEGMLLWCPILRAYGVADCCTTAVTIVPHSIGYCNAGYLFCEPDNGFDLLWSAKNRNIMSENLATGFRNGDFVLVPVGPSIETEPCEWWFILMNEKLREYPVQFSSTYNDLDGQVLQWKNNRDVDDGDEVFADGVFDEKDDKAEERLIAQEIFVAQECVMLDEDDVWIETEESWDLLWEASYEGSSYTEELLWEDKRA
ncbi:MAG: hypothetical protein FRX48_03275 [Lasallia pustulata]|uniref:Uncharacterized protein n=1 Tax=Lasallia pustulata TaxID=136370 RepID=A0A5M8PWU4_9LECA|nr:MAG: hypothetical protein FRX48_03275 [Lasallia pustulata]